MVFAGPSVRRETSAAEERTNGTGKGIASVQGCFMHAAISPSAVDQHWTARGVRADPRFVGPSRPACIERLAEEGGGNERTVINS